ncbi:hypothetical protein [Ferruginibacter profundus]
MVKILKGSSPQQVDKRFKKSFTYGRQHNMATGIHRLAGVSRRFIAEAIAVISVA